MTIEQIVCVSFGSILQAVVFALGVAVGISLTKRRDSHNDSDEGKTEKAWHQVERR